MIARTPNRTGKPRTSSRSVRRYQSATVPRSATTAIAPPTSLQREAAAGALLAEIRPHMASRAPMWGRVVVQPSSRHGRYRLH